MLRTGSVVILLGLLVALVVSCQPSRRGPSEADIAFLASDAHVVVGDVPLVLPFIALPDQVSMGQVFTLDRQEALEEWREQRGAFRAAASPGGAPTLDRVGVHIDTWGWGNDENVPTWMTLCPRLTREWSRSVCDDPWAPLQQALPGTKFHLADDRQLDTFDHYWTIGMERMSDQLRAMTLRPGEVSVVCDRELSTRGGRHCSAAQPIQDHLVAVWLLGDGEDETAEEQAEREGRSIAAFVTLALGPEEDFPALVAVACDTRQPGSGPSGVPSSPPYPCTD